MSEEQILKQKLQSLVDFDKLVRFVGCLASDGTILSYAQRPGLVPLLDTHEIRKSYMHTVLRAASYKTLDEKLGTPIWTITLRKKIKWLTVYLNDGCMIVISIEVNSSHDKIMQKTLDVFEVKM